MAKDFASGAMTAMEIAAKYGLSYSHVASIASGRKVPRIKVMVDAFVEENTKAVLRIAKTQAKYAVAKLSRMAANQPANPGDDPPYSEDIEHRACNDIIELAYRDVAEANTSHQHLHVDGGVVLLADVARGQSTIPIERRAALGLDDPMPPSNGNGHPGGHAKLIDGGGNGNGHAGGNGHATSPGNGHG